MKGRVRGRARNPQPREAWFCLFSLPTARCISKEAASTFSGHTATAPRVRFHFSLIGSKMSLVVKPNSDLSNDRVKLKEER